MNDQTPLPSFSPADIQKVLGSKEGKQLLQLLTRDGGATLKQAADAVSSGNFGKAWEVLNPVMQTPQATELVDKINQK